MTMIQSQIVRFMLAAHASDAMTAGVALCGACLPVSCSRQALVPYLCNRSIEIVEAVHACTDALLYARCKEDIHPAALQLCDLHTHVGAELFELLASCANCYLNHAQHDDTSRMNRVNCARLQVVRQPVHLVSERTSHN
jgi:hypothetical protein